MFSIAVCLILVCFIFAAAVVALVVDGVVFAVGIAVAVDVVIVARRLSSLSTTCSDLKKRGCVLPVPV